MGLEFTKVDGEVKGKHVRLFALSTCGWCRKTKRFLENNNIEFEFVYVDQLSGSDREFAREEVKKHNPRCSYPTIVIDGQECIVGFDEDQLREMLDST